MSSQKPPETFEEWQSSYRSRGQDCRDAFEAGKRAGAAAMRAAAMDTDCANTSRCCCIYRDRAIRTLPLPGDERGER